MNALADLSSAGVAVWLDDLSRERLRSGNLAELIRDHSVVGVTTNPSLVAKEGRVFKDVVLEICGLTDGPVSAEVIDLIELLKRSL